MSGLRRKITGMVPQPARFQLRKLLYHGNLYTCPLCRSSVKEYLSHGGGFEVLDRRRVVGGMKREHDQCPACRSADRTRLMMLFLKNKIFQNRYREKIRILHVAPEYGLFLWLKRQSNIDYYGTDLDFARYRHIENIQKADLTNLPYEDSYFDIIICSHVLEHVPDDKAAMKEIRRVIKPGGTAMLMVPLATDDKPTEEDPNIHNPQEQERLFGQWDHVRIYHKDDFIARLQDVGLSVNVFNGFDEFPDEAATLNLNPQENLIVCTK